MEVLLCLQIVRDLADQNIIDEKDICGDEDLAEVRATQVEAVRQFSDLFVEPKLETPRMLVLSTAHITKETDWNFGEHTDDVPGNYYPLPCGGLDGEVYGYLIPCGPDMHWSHMVSADLVAIRKVAEDAGCTWIRLDRDARHVPGLPIYDWLCV